MTSSIPDGFSLEQLQQMMENAPSECSDHNEDNCTCGGPVTPEQKRILSDVKEAIDRVNMRYQDPAVMKMAAMTALTTLADWHKEVAEKNFEDDNIQGLGWAMDARSLEICMLTLSRVNVGPNDWLTED